MQLQVHRIEDEGKLRIAIGEAFEHEREFVIGILLTQHANGLRAIAGDGRLEDGRDLDGWPRKDETAVD